MKRCENKSDANCEISQHLVDDISTMTVDGRGYTDASSVEIPIMTNFKAIEKHGELVVHWVDQKPKSHKKEAAASTTWYEEAQKVAKRSRKG